MSGLVLLACAETAPSQPNSASGSGGLSSGQSGSDGGNLAQGGNVTSGGTGASQGGASGGAAGISSGGTQNGASGASSASGASGASGASAGAGAASGGNANSSGSAGQAGGGTASAGVGGSVAGAGGSMSGSGGSAGANGGTGGQGELVSSFSCNTVFGIDATSEWFTAGFENRVADGKWQIIYNHPGFVENWANANDAVWSKAPTSACAANANNPDRVIFNVFADPADTAFASVNSWKTGLTQSIANMKAKYSRLKRVDLLTMTRAPNNTPCDPSNRMSVVEQYVDDAIAQVVAANTGPLVITAVQKFFAPSCDVFKDGGPHFTPAGGMTVAGIYGQYYSAEK